MLSRFIAKSSNLRFLTLIPSHSPPHNLRPPIPISNPVCFSDKIPRFYSTNGGDKNDHHLWNITSEADDSADSLFGEEQPEAPAGPMETAQKLDPESLNGGGNTDDLFGDPVAPASSREAAQKWDPEALDGGGGADDLFGDPVAPESPREAAQKWDLESLNGSGGDDLFVEVTGEERPTAEEHKQWNLGGEEALNGGGGADDLFGDPVAPASPQEATQKWDLESLNGSGSGDDLFVEETEEWRPTAEEQWNLGGEEDVELDLFKGEDLPQQVDLEELRLKNAAVQAEEEKKKKLLEAEEKILTEIVKGPKRAFGDLIAASGITDEMLDTLLALKDFGGIPGLRPLQELEDERYLKNTTKSTKAEIERLKQEEVAKARVQHIDAKGRAYGTGRRKCSVARVWIQPGEGKFIVNDKEFDVCFPMIEHRAVLLRPFSETKTLGKWNVNCTAKGGGVSGQVGAIRLGISRALQNWAPDLRPPLRAAGFLTRDSRVVERKKPGKAKARKSFQWVKR